CAAEGFFFQNVTHPWGRETACAERKKETEEKKKRKKKRNGRKKETEEKKKRKKKRNGRKKERILGVRRVHTGCESRRGPHHRLHPLERGHIRFGLCWSERRRRRFSPAAKAYPRSALQWAGIRFSRKTGLFALGAKAKQGFLSYGGGGWRRLSTFQRR